MFQVYILSSRKMIFMQDESDKIEKDDAKKLL